MAKINGQIIFYRVITESTVRQFKMKPILMKISELMNTYI